MRIGAEDRNRIIILGVLLLIAAFAVPRIFSGGSSATPGQSQTAATATTQRTANSTARSGKKAPPRKPMLAQSLDPSLRFDLLKQGEGQEYEGSKRNIFSSEPMVKVPDVVDPDKIVRKEPPPPPPGPPPIPLKFYGFATQAGQAKRVFLSSTTSDDIFVGSEGQVINKRYRIVKIENADVIVEDILNNNQQKLVLSPPS